MSYATIDSALTSWGIKNNIKIFTKAQDWEIRSFAINNQKYLLGFPKNGAMKVKIFNVSEKFS